MSLLIWSHFDISWNSDTAFSLFSLNHFFDFTGHEFVAITYHMPTACEVCTKPLWHVFKPPAAFECRRYVQNGYINKLPGNLFENNFFGWIFHFRCRNKVHKEHIDNNDLMVPCKLHHDPHSAREMLLLATSNEEQKSWVNRLSKRIQKSGYKANSLNNNNTGNDGNKISTRWSDRIWI